MNDAQQRPALQTALVFLAVISVVSLLWVVARRPPLTTENVKDDARRLQQLVAWTTPQPADAQATTQVTYTFASPCGRITGLALIEQWDRSGGLTRPESHLWFSLARDETRWFRSLSRRPLPSAVILRNPLNSDLVPSSSKNRLSLSIEPTSQLPTLGGVLSIDNLKGDLGRPFSRSSNRALTTVLRSSHCQFTAFDLELFSLLPKLLRGRLCGADGEGQPCDDVALTISRRRRGRTYDVLLQSLGQDRGKLPFTLKVTRYRDGPRTAVLRLDRSRATLDRAASLYVVAPHPPGKMLTPDLPGSLALHYRPKKYPNRALVGQIDFDQLLAGTTWR